MSASSAPARYAVLVSSGKSGSKRVLKILDLSPATFCRCEPNALAGSPFHRLPTWSLRLPDTDAAMDAGWDEAIAWAARHLGERDRVPTPPKNFLYPWARWLQLDRPLRHQRLRRLLGVILPAWRGSEWPLPRFLGSREDLARATFVVKTGNAPGWTPWLLRHRPQVPVIVVLRHPGGFLYSYRERWMRNSDAGATLEGSRQRLRELTRVEPTWSRRVGDIDSLSIEELELWYWIYSNELFVEEGKDCPQFELVRDEDVVADPVAVARKLFQRVGLEWQPRAQAYLERMGPAWKACSAPWRELLAPRQVALVERVLSTSPLQRLWTDDEVVSRHDYEAY